MEKKYFTYHEHSACFFCCCCRPITSILQTQPKMGKPSLEAWAAGPLEPSGMPVFNVFRGCFCQHLGNHVIFSSVAHFLVKVELSPRISMLSHLWEVLVENTTFRQASLEISQHSSLKVYYLTEKTADSAHKSTLPGTGRKLQGGMSVSVLICSSTRFLFLLLGEEIS